MHHLYIGGTANKRTQDQVNRAKLHYGFHSVKLLLDPTKVACQHNEHHTNYGLLNTTLRSQ
jgi:hypothetical protein